MESAIVERDIKRFSLDAIGGQKERFHHLDRISKYPLQSNVDWSVDTRVVEVLYDFSKMNHVEEWQKKFLLWDVFGQRVINLMENSDIIKVVTEANRQYLPYLKGEDEQRCMGVANLMTPGELKLIYDNTEFTGNVYVPVQLQWMRTCKENMTQTLHRKPTREEFNNTWFNLSHNSSKYRVFRLLTTINGGSEVQFKDKFDIDKPISWFISEQS